MATATSAALLLSCLLLAFISLAATPAEAQSHSYYSQDSYMRPRYYRREWAQPRSFWSRARSIMPRFYQVASDAASVLALPTLAVLALSAIWPQHTHYRSKREADDPDAPMEELTQHLMNVYLAAVESDGCMQRVVCELGAVARNLKPYQRNLMISVLSSAVPVKHSHLFSKFKAGVNAETCHKYSCSMLDN
ncbi:uncharacterized protein [Panulirus ornatus]|uniref:uncharacterized protein isoform X2 n=1 Tax=Panulirus ornatus TaxID=150431 RepID=UPI003A85A70F